MVKLGKVICSLPQIPPEFSYVLGSGDRGAARQQSKNAPRHSHSRRSLWGRILLSLQIKIGRRLVSM